MKQMQGFIGQIAKTGLRNAERGEHTAVIVWKEISFRFFKDKDGVG